MKENHPEADAAIKKAIDDLWPALLRDRILDPASIVDTQDFGHSQSRIVGVGIEGGGYDVEIEVRVRALVHRHDRPNA